jgi:hypothetical protein
MLQLILNWLGGPVISAGIEAYKAKITAENDADARTTELAGKALLLDQREAELRSQERIALIGRWYEPVNLMGYLLVLYIGKVVLFDSMLGLGETPAIKGAVGEWLGMIATFFVGTRGAVSVAAILRRR